VIPEGPAPSELTRTASQKFLVKVIVLFSPLMIGVSSFFAEKKD